MCDEQKQQKSWVPLRQKVVVGDVAHKDQINEFLSQVNLSHCGVFLKEAKSTNSVYIKIKNANKKSIVLRFSDHPKAAEDEVIRDDFLLDVNFENRRQIIACLINHNKGIRVINMRRPAKNFWERTAL